MKKGSIVKVIYKREVKGKVMRTGVIAAVTKN